MPFIFRRPFFVTFALFLVLTAPGVAGQALTLDDFDGTVEARTDSVWKTLDVGALIPPSATLRISNHGLAELHQGNLKIHLSKDGSYQLAALLAKAMATPATGLVARASSQVGYLLGEGQDHRVNTANMGARGAEQTKGADVQWADESDLTPGSRPSDGDAEALMAQGLFLQALKKTEADLSAPGADVASVTLRKARILSLMGRPASALKTAAGVDVPPDSPLRPALDLLVASQALAVDNFDLAVQRAQAGLSGSPAPEVSQSFELILGLGYQGLGRQSEAHTLFQKLVDEAPASPSGHEASKLLAPGS